VVSSRSWGFSQLGVAVSLRLQGGLVEVMFFFVLGANVTC
jgi:hypothetical protein